jgi:hypothetical protein
MRGAEGEAALPDLRTLHNKADAVGSARPEGKNAGFFEMNFRKPNEKSVYRQFRVSRACVIKVG